MTYCIEVWGCASQTQLNCLVLLQKKMIRITSFYHYLATYQSTFPFNGSSFFQENFFYKVGLILYKYSNNLLPESISISIRFVCIYNPIYVFWLKLNKLTVNFSKTKFMIVHKRRDTPQLDLLLNNIKIELLSNFTFLGIILDSSLVEISQN